jgi:hypothetical protein
MADEQQKEGLVKRFLNKIKSQRPEEVRSELEQVQKEVEALDPKQEDIKQDMKVVGKLALAAIQKLPKPEFEAYKNSEDFQKLKEILKKYEIIKEN